MGSYEPLVLPDQFQAWMGEFHERYGASPYEVLNGVGGPFSDAAYAEAYGAWLAGMEVKSRRVQYGEDQGVGAARS